MAVAIGLNCRPLPGGRTISESESVTPTGTRTDVSARQSRWVPRLVRPPPLRAVTVRYGPTAWQHVVLVSWSGVSGGRGHVTSTRATMILSEAPDPGHRAGPVRGGCPPGASDIISSCGSDIIVLSRAGPHS